MSDWSQPQTLDFIPEGKLVIFMATHQAAFTQSIQIIDAQGNPIAFTPLMTAHTRDFPINGQGTVIGLFNPGVGQFIMKKEYKVQFKNSGPIVSKVAATTPSEFFIDEQTKGGGAFFVTEDDGGSDYNDTSLALQWFTSQG